MSQVLSKDSVPGLIEEYMQTFFEENPGAAAYLGLHEYDGKVADVSQSAITRRVAGLKQMLARLDRLTTAGEDKETRFDRLLLGHRLEHELFNLEEMRPYERNPMFYTDLIEVSGYIKRNYAPLAQRLDALIRHLEKVPTVLSQARANLDRELPRPVLETSIGMYEGLVKYYENDVTAEFDKAAQAGLSARFVGVRDKATAALRDFVGLLRERLALATNNFPIGLEKYRRMLATGEMVDLPVEKVLEVGRRDLAENLRQLHELCERHWPGQAVSQVMKDMASHHPTPQSLVPDTERMLEEIRQFLLDHNIVSVPSEVRCLVAETPPFMRWAFAFMDAPGPFEQVAKEAYYYVTPVEADWTDQQKEEWLTKFDYYTLQDVSVHEAYPGHYLHFLHTKLVPSRFRQMVAAYSFVEGWAHYTEQMMLEEGFGGADPRFKLGQLAEALLRSCRYIVAILMHTQGMTVDEATRFIMENAYMEETPARSEAVRGTFDPGYLNYTLGKLLLLKLRQDYQAEQGPNFSLRQFHDRALAYGAPPIPLLRTILLETDKGDIL